MKLKPIKYEDLNAKAEKTYKFNESASILADFISIHIDVVATYKIRKFT